MSDMEGIRCPVCGKQIKVRTSTSQRGKVALVLACPQDGRHLRAFINDPEYVRGVVETLERGAGTNQKPD